MDMTLYLEARAIAHTAVALNARMTPFGLGTLDSERLDWLVTYQSLLSAAEAQLGDRTDISDDIKAVQLNMLAAVRGHTLEGVDAIVERTPQFPRDGFDDRPDACRRR
jgi:hypothetical protein